MINSGNAVRFTALEIENYRKVGIDISNVKTEADLESAIERWSLTLSEEHPSLLEKIAVCMAGKKGVELPPKLALIASSLEGSEQ